ncbi:MAG: sodium:solute symporter family protein [Clostridia bacterium]|nr:sodium:solute symporter family protein [Clostridia bacterium]
MVWDYIVLILYALSMVAIAYFTRKRSKSVDDFLHAGKKGINGWMSAFAYGTTYFSAVVFVGYAGKFGSSFGLASVWIGIANAVIGSLIAWLVLARRTKNMTVRLNSKTMPDFFEKRYESKNLKFVSAVVIFIFLIPYSASVYSGLSSLFEFVFGIEGWIVMLALALLTAVYLFFGGYFATALSDFIQGIIMLFGVVIMVILFLCNDNVNWDLSRLTSDVNKTWFTFGSTNGGFFGSTMTLLSLIFLTSFGVWALPQTIHKYYAIRDKKAITQGTIVSTVFALVIGFGAYFVGALSGLFPTELLAGVKGDNIIPVLLKEVIPVGLIGVIAVLILSASMSTLSSVSLASASVVAVDLYKGKINEKASDKRVNIVMKSLCLVFIAISVILAILNEEANFSAIAYMMGISWGTLAGCFIGPFVLGVIWKRVTKSAVWTSIISCLVLTATLIIVLGYNHPNCTGTFGSAFVNGINCSPMIGSICMIFSLIITTVVSLLTKQPSDEAIYNAFEKPIENEV